MLAGIRADPLRSAALPGATTGLWSIVSSRPITKFGQSEFSSVSGSVALSRSSPAPLFMTAGTGAMEVPFWGSKLTVGRRSRASRVDQGRR